MRKGKVITAAEAARRKKSLKAKKFFAIPSDEFSSPNTQAEAIQYAREFLAECCNDRCCPDKSYLIVKVVGVVEPVAKKLEQRFIFTPEE